MTDRAKRLLRVTDRQLALLRYMADSPTFVCQLTPHALDALSGCAIPYFWPQHAPTPRPMADGRVITPLVTRGILRYIGDGDYDLSPDARRTLTDG